LFSTVYTHNRPDQVQSGVTMYNRRHGTEPLSSP